MPKGQQRSNREKKKPKKPRARVPIARRIPGLPYTPYDRKISSGRNAETVTFGTSTTLLTRRSTATLQIT
jgi:hypothetical protein